MPRARSLRPNAWAHPKPSKALTTKAIAGICRLKSTSEWKIGTAATAKPAAGR